MTKKLYDQCFDSAEDGEKLRLYMTRCIRFSTTGSNLETAMMIKESVRSQLRSHGIDYEELSQLPYNVRIAERDYLLFCLVWDSDSYPWREVSAEKGLQG